MESLKERWQVPGQRLERALRSIATHQIDEADHQECRNAYYGGRRSVEPSVRRWRKKRGVSGREIDLFQMHVNAVLGAEAQRQVEWTSVADKESGEEVAEATNVLINKMSRLHDVNHHCSEAYKWQIINGLGWVYFGRNPNPAASRKYECENISSTEILWDRRSKRLDLEDCDWIARRRYLSKDQVAGVFPEHKKMIDTTFSKRGSWGPFHGSSMGGAMLEGACFVGDMGLSDRMYRNTMHDEGEVAVFDLYYRMTEMRTHIVLPGDDMPVEYDEHDSEHVAALFTKQSVPFRAPVRVMRNAWFVGPYLMEDGPSRHPHDMFPYAMARGYQEDDSNVVYGMGRSLLSPCRAYNDAKTHIFLLLEKITVKIGTNALAASPYTLEEIISEAQKVDAVFEVPENSDIEIQQHYEHIHELIGIMQQSLEEARLVSGVSSNFTGQEQSQQSGVAMQVSVDQTTKALADLDENYQMFRRQVGIIMLAHARYDVGLKQIDVPIKEDGETTKVITLNKPDERGKILNDFRRTRMQVVMAEIQTSAGYRAQQHAMFRESMPGAAEQIQPILAEGMIKTSNLPSEDKNRMLAKMRKVYGTSPDPEEQAKLDQQAAEAAEEERKLVQRERLAEIHKLESETAWNIARAQSEPVGGEAGAPPADEAARVDKALADDESEKAAIVREMRERIAERAATPRQQIAA